MLIALLCLAVALTCGEARADIYRYLNEEGVECFTDAPTAGNAVKIMRESAATRQKPPKQGRQASRPANPPDPGNCRTEAEPLLPVKGVITSPVGLRHDPIDGVIRDHKGVDIATPSGTPVRPIAPGVVIYSGYRPGYGNTVIVRHDDGMTTLYAHNSTNLKGEGEPVDRGSTIAFSGSTGRTTGPHLHFEAWKDGVNVTATFVPGAAARHEAGRDHDFVRRTVQADGTLVFTNLP